MSDQAKTGTQRSTAEKVKDRVGDATDSVQEKASHVAAGARDRGAQLVDQGREKAHELGDRAGSIARSRADEEKARLTGGIRTFADVLRRGSDDLAADRSQYRPLLAGAADRVEGISNYLEQRDVDALTNDVRRFARDNTPLFLGGVFALGFLGARFLKSSGEHAARERAQGLHTDFGGEERFDRMLAAPDTGDGSDTSSFGTRSGTPAHEDPSGLRGGMYE
jgi:hypothetical protein